jgi:ABC-type Fe3+-hydroxamate transport system substrate-binding protein
MTTLLLDDPLQFFSGQSPQRVVSLVPSWTANLYDFGLHDRLVGISDFCEVPPSDARKIGSVGRPVDPQVEKIIQLKPDLVLANKEENGRNAIEALCDAQIPVWLTFPKTINDMLEDLRKACELFRSETALSQYQILERNIEWAELSSHEQTPVRYFCPIWEDILDNAMKWWMTFNNDTYSADVLRILNGKNVFAGRTRKYPIAADLGLVASEPAEDRDTRYPRLTFDEILASEPEVILLPDEPYPYQKADIARIQEQFIQTPAAQNGRIYLIQGSLIHWPGTILARALEELAFLFV